MWGWHDSHRNSLVRGHRLRRDRNADRVAGGRDRARAARRGRQGRPPRRHPEGSSAGGRKYFTGVLDYDVDSTNYKTCLDQMKVWFGYSYPTVRPAATSQQP